MIPGYRDVKIEARLKMAENCGPRDEKKDSRDSNDVNCDDSKSKKK